MRSQSLLQVFLDMVRHACDKTSANVELDRRQRESLFEEQLVADKRRYLKNSTRCILSIFHLLPSRFSQRIAKLIQLRVPLPRSQ